VFIGIHCFGSERSYRRAWEGIPCLKVAS
jgi:hypothetical protein